MLTLFFDLFFPRRCVGCNQEGSWVCPACQKIILQGKGPFWLGTEDEFHPLIAGFPFEAGLVRELLHHLKYNGIQEIAPLLIDLLIQVKGVSERIQSNWVLIPVPTSRTKLKKRGYNQAEELARALGHQFELPVWIALGRNKSGSQVGKNKQQRQEGLSAAFHWQGEREVEQMRTRQWILVDDVYTTGSTLRACLEVLQQRTTAPIGALVIARK